MKKTLIASISAGLLAVAVAAPASGGLVEPVGLVYAPKDCSEPRIEPHRITLACGDANAGLQKMQWSEWGGEKAKGTGWLALNDCDPNCADGTFHTYGVKAKLKEIETGKCAGQTVDLYTHAKLRFIGEVPPGRHLRNWDLECNA